ncbi:hypothetical protein GF373_13195 [bacterium]|nr:hypothetical protein [bacterium]
MCPHCGEPLVVFELEAVEIDYCVDCGGTWLDAGEMELLLEMEGAESGHLADVLLTAQANKKTQLPCPRCKTKMDAFCIGEDKKVELDRCPRQHGIWLDAGEMNQIINEFHEGELGQVSAFFSNLYKANLTK